MKNNKIVLLIFFSISMIPMTPFNAQIIYEANENNLSLIVKKDLFGNMVIELKNLKTNQFDTIWTQSLGFKPENIMDLKFSENYCGFILVTEGLIQYVLLAKEESSWKVIGGEIILFRRDYYTKPLGFGGVRLLNEFTFIIHKNTSSGVFSKIHMYDDQGNKKIFEEVGFDEFRNKKD